MSSITNAWKRISGQDKTHKEQQCQQKTKVL